jgi:hypothetical protein
VSFLIIWRHLITGMEMEKNQSMLNNVPNQAVDDFNRFYVSPYQRVLKTQLV